MTSTGLASMVYVPETFDSKTARVVVVIHGCLQSAEAMAAGTGWNGIADRHNLVIIYPQVPSGSHPMDCWSWYLSGNQSSTSGQLKILRDDVQKQIQRLELSNPLVFVTGISSGGAMAAGLMACFPAEFAAGAIHSAPSYGVATNLKESVKILKEGPGPKPVNKGPCKPQDFTGPVLVLHGLRDEVVNPQNAEGIITSFKGNDFQERQSERRVNGIALSQTDYFREGQLQVRQIKIPHLAHAWSGADKTLRNTSFVNSKAKIPTILPFFEPSNPSSTDLIWDFWVGMKAK